MTPTLETFVATHAPRIGRMIAMLRASAAELDSGEPSARVSRNLRRKLTLEMQGSDQIPLLLTVLRKWDKLGQPAVFAESLRFEAQRFETAVVHLIGDLTEGKN